jgi:hypothetical protein
MSLCPVEIAPTFADSILSKRFSSFRFFGLGHDDMDSIFVDSDKIWCRFTILAIFGCGATS